MNEQLNTSEIKDKSVWWCACAYGAVWLNNSRLRELREELLGYSKAGRWTLQVRVEPTVLLFPFPTERSLKVYDKKWGCDKKIKMPCCCLWCWFRHKGPCIAKATHKKCTFEHTNAFLKCWPSAQVPPKDLQVMIIAKSATRCVWRSRG